MLLKRIEFLKTTPFVPHSKPSKKLIREQLRRKLEVIKYIKPLDGNDKYADIKAIARFYRIKLILCPNLKTAGSAHFDRIIRVCVGSKHLPITDALIRKTFCHELAHILQKDVKIWKLNSYSLAQSLRFEQEAESAAVILFKKLFPQYKFNMKYFKSYFSESDILFLQQYADKDIKNDLFCLK